MTPLAKRYALPALAVVAAGLALIQLGSRDIRADECADPEALFFPEHFETIRPFEAVQAKVTEETPLWAKGAIRMEMPGIQHAPEFEVAVFRSFRPIRLYLQPEQLNPLPAAPDKGRFEWLESDEGDLPVHFVYAQSRNSALFRTTFLAYFFVYGNEPVARPFMAQMASAIPDIGRGRRPLSVFMVKGGVSNLYLEQAEERARQWLADAWKRYRETCSS